MGGGYGRRQRGANMLVPSTISLTCTNDRWCGLKRGETARITFRRTIPAFPARHSPSTAPFLRGVPPDGSLGDLRDTSLVAAAKAGINLRPSTNPGALLIPLHMLSHAVRRDADMVKL